MTSMNADESLRQEILTSKIPSSRKTFVHRSLNLHESSIRLVQILPDLSPEGLIQCTISHGTLEASYSCLSYMWGAEHPACEIYIDDKTFYVRQNLFDFLEVSRRTPDLSPRKFWIDAVSIDQRNTLERNHQVQQMGNIFEKAEDVVLWLGDHHALSILCDNNSSPGYVGLVPIRHRITSKSIIDIQELLYDHPYWKRAWVTQELLLARHVTVIQGTRRITWSQFRQALVCYRHPSYKSPLGDFESINRSDNLRDASLVSLLIYFRGRECMIPRDRIYSLLSICRDGAVVKVDYSIPESVLMYEILSCCTDTFCLCSAYIVAKSLVIRQNIPMDRSLLMEIPIRVYHYGQGRDYVTYNLTSMDKEGRRETSFVFPSSGSCGSTVLPELHWKKPLVKGEEAIVSAHYRGPPSCIRNLCTYGNGFEILKKSGDCWVARIEFWAFAEMSLKVSKLCSHGRGERGGISTSIYKIIDERL